MMKKRLLPNFLVLTSIVATSCIGLVRLVAQVQADSNANDTRPKQWQSVVGAAYNRDTSVSSLSLNTYLLQQSGQPRKFKFLNLWQYDVDKQKWIKMERREEQSVVLNPKTEETNRELVRLTDKIGLFWAQWEEDERQTSTLVFAGPIMCNDIMMGEPPKGMIATCVPFPDHATAMFVPDPEVHCQN